LYQIYAKLEGKDWELIDTAETEKDLDYMLGEYRLAYGKGWTWRVEEVEDEEEEQ